MCFQLFNNCWDTGNNLSIPRVLQEAAAEQLGKLLASMLGTLGATCRAPRIMTRSRYKLAGQRKLPGDVGPPYRAGGFLVLRTPFPGQCSLTLSPSRLLNNDRSSAGNIRDCHLLLALLLSLRSSVLQYNAEVVLLLSGTQ